MERLKSRSGSPQTPQVPRLSQQGPLANWLDVNVSVPLSPSPEHVYISNLLSSHLAFRDYSKRSVLLEEVYHFGQQQNSALSCDSVNSATISSFLTVLFAQRIQIFIEVVLETLPDHSTTLYGPRTRAKFAKVA